ncbi:hypothetical protein IV203_002873 [Nitzschia inconspicua]|uniref:Uncharacterized protein n=1 Tax=Nitzschia inconspicua TaxID=303405 RepID=A0A9K3PN73_9STRA|nr:hypothetical protein IV203_002873 [Nitzschia inconspicua]
MKQSTILLTAVAAMGRVTTEALMIYSSSTSSTPLFCDSYRVSHTRLFAMPPSSNANNGGAQSSSTSSTTTASSSTWGGTRPKFAVPSKTARESAVNVEWEPMTELERRIEDGIHYEHIQNHYYHHSTNHLQQTKFRRHDTSTGATDDDAKSSAASVAAKAVFCGYRYTEDEYNRLKSADIVE